MDVRDTSITMVENKWSIGAANILKGWRFILWQRPGSGRSVQGRSKKRLISRSSCSKRCQDSGWAINLPATRKRSSKRERPARLAYLDRHGVLNACLAFDLKARTGHHRNKSSPLPGVVHKVPGCKVPLGIHRIFIKTYIGRYAIDNTLLIFFYSVVLHNK